VRCGMILTFIPVCVCVCASERVRDKSIKNCGSCSAMLKNTWVIKCLMILRDKMRARSMDWMKRERNCEMWGNGLCCHSMLRVCGWQKMFTCSSDKPLNLLTSLFHNFYFYNLIDLNKSHIVRDILQSPFVCRLKLYSFFIFIKATNKLWFARNKHSTMFRSTNLKGFRRRRAHLKNSIFIHIL
jgi:hypothetical protein